MKHTRSEEYQKSVVVPARSSGLNAILLQVKHALTLTEKILAKHANSQKVSPGDNIWTSVDKLLTHDVCGPGTFGIFEKEFGPKAQVWDPERVIIIPDHYIFTEDVRANRNVDIIRYSITLKLVTERSESRKGGCAVRGWLFHANLMDRSRDAQSPP